MKPDTAIKKSNGLHPAIIITSVAVFYFVTAKFGLLLAFSTQQVTAVWPASGIALVALLLFGRTA